QESVVVFLVGSVYVLLAAGIDLDELRGLFPEALVVVGALALLGRPLLVVLSSWGSNLNWRERVFLSAVAPRGVVAASLAGVVALEATPRLANDGGPLVAMVFVVIATTIAVQSAYAGIISQWLKVYPMTTVIAGAGATGRHLASKLTSAGRDVVLLDSDEASVTRAREEGFDVVLGDIGSIDALRKARLADATAFVITTPDDDRALLAARLATTEFGCRNVIARVDEPVNATVFRDLGVTVVSPSEATAAEIAMARGEPQIAGLLAAATTGAVGAFALDRIAAFSASESAPVGLTAATMAGVLGLWIAAASGLRRLETVRDPVIEKSDAVLEGLVEPVLGKVKDGLSTWEEIHQGIAKDAQMSGDTAGEALRQGRRLVESMLETAQTWKQIHADLSSPRLAGIAEKLAEFEKRIGETEDEVTKGHLLRAAQALRAQKSAIDGLKVGTGRAEAALDAQVALLERLRLAVAQHRVSDRERFAVEVSAVADQVSRLSDDLESLSAAIAEAESLSDRRVLADLERAGRRALEQLGEPTEVDAPAEIAAEAEAARRS
ncbi:MAG: NAD-binding protein, partial [Deltaproteobacteria bacterium]|nr:NAD-binding protein [Deltaproteobacteria bacterium]